MSSEANPSIDDLRALSMFSEVQSVTKAAKRLGIRQPSLSRRLAAFRGKNPLLHTRGNTVELTEKGRAALPAVNQILRQYDQLCQYLADREDTLQSLRLATGSIASQWYVAQAIACFREQRHDLQIQTQVARGEERICGTANGAFDIAVVSHDPLRIENTVRQKCGIEFNLSVIELTTCCMAAVARSDTPAGAKLSAVLAGQEVPLSLLTKLDLLGLDRRSGIRRLLEAKFRSSATKISFIGEVGGWLALTEFVKQGLGSAIVPLAVLSREDSTNLVIRRLPSDIAIRHYVIHRVDDDRAEVLQLKECLVAAASKHEQDVGRIWQGIL